MSEKTCVMCKSREGTQLSTAGRWFCQKCIDWLPPTNEEDEKDARIEELQKALEEIKELIPIMQDDEESPELIYNTGNMILHKINQALKVGNEE